MSRNTLPEKWIRSERSPRAVDLADYLVALAAPSTGSHDTVTVSTTADTPTMWQMIRREAFNERVD